MADPTPAPPLTPAALRLLVVLRNVPDFLDCPDDAEATPNDLRLLRATGATVADVRAALDFYTWGLDQLQLRIDAEARILRAQTDRGPIDPGDQAVLLAPGPFDAY